MDAFDDYPCHYTVIAISIPSSCRILVLFYGFERRKKKTQCLWEKKNSNSSWSTIKKKAF